MDTWVQTHKQEITIIIISVVIIGRVKTIHEQ